MKIEIAKKEQLNDIFSVIKGSIQCLCIKDHGNNSDKLTAWLKHKSIEISQQWFFNHASRAFVAIENKQIVGVSHIDNEGFLYQCCVSPHSIGCGFGRLLLAAAEMQAARWGVRVVTLESTLSSQRFYEHHGYVVNGKSFLVNHMMVYPLKKKVSTNAIIY